ncbi:hypothetical protein C8R47DRAFT_1255828 [Mycena vitilis]|nr:hypothetical protein C8R47DRAFT_1255828 [Mycena vitilis]
MLDLRHQLEIVIRDEEKSIGTFGWPGLESNELPGVQARHSMGCGFDSSESFELCRSQRVVSKKRLVWDAPNGPSSSRTQFVLLLVLTRRRVSSDADSSGLFRKKTRLAVELRKTKKPLATLRLMARADCDRADAEASRSKNELPAEHFWLANPLQLQILVEPRLAGCSLTPLTPARDLSLEEYNMRPDASGLGGLNGRKGWLSDAMEGGSKERGNTDQSINARIAVLLVLRQPASSASGVPGGAGLRAAGGGGRANTQRHWYKGIDGYRRSFSVTIFPFFLLCGKLRERCSSSAAYLHSALLNSPDSPSTKILGLRITSAPRPAYICGGNNASDDSNGRWPELRLVVLKVFCLSFLGSESLPSVTQKHKDFLPSFPARPSVPANSFPTSIGAERRIVRVNALNDPSDKFVPARVLSRKGWPRTDPSITFVPACAL